MDAVGVEADSSKEASKVAVMAEAAVAATMIRPYPTILSMELIFGTIPENLALWNGTTLATTAGHISPEFSVDAAEDEVLILAAETPVITRGGQMNRRPQIIRRIIKDRIQDVEEGELGIALALEEEGNDPSVMSQQPHIKCAGYQPGGDHCMAWHT